MSKFQDMKEYYSLIKFACAYPDDTTLFLSNDTNILNQSHALMIGLPEEYGIKDFSFFINIYKSYRDWLLEKYINPNYYFSNHYHRLNYYKSRNGFEKAKDFKEEFGGLAEHYIFLATTMSDYFEDCSSALFLEQKDSGADMKAFGEVAHKMYYGCLFLKDKIGYKHISTALDIEMRTIEKGWGIDRAIIRNY